MFVSADLAEVALVATPVDKRYASRKFLLAATALLAGIAFFALGRLTAPEWISYMQWLVAIYAAANVSDQAVTTRT